MSGQDNPNGVTKKSSALKKRNIPDLRFNKKMEEISFLPLSRTFCISFAAIVLENPKKIQKEYYTNGGNILHRLQTLKHQ
jgi:hypothetical protein